MAAYQQSKQEYGQSNEDEMGYRDQKASDSGDTNANASASASSAFEIAVAVANAADKRKQEAKEAKSSGFKSEKESSYTTTTASSSSSSSSSSKGYRLLGDLPSLGGPKNTKEEIKIALALELPGEQKKNLKFMVLNLF